MLNQRGAGEGDDLRQVEVLPARRLAVYRGVIAAYQQRWSTCPAAHRDHLTRPGTFYTAHLFHFLNIRQLGSD